MYRLLAIAKYEERYVIPPAHAEQAHSLEELATECSLDYEGGPGMGGSGPFGEGSGGADARSRWRTSRCCRTGRRATRAPRPPPSRGRVNLLNWDGKRPPGRALPSPGRGHRARPGGHDGRSPVSGHPHPALGAHGCAWLAEHVPAAGLSRRGAPGAGPPRGGGRPSAARRPWRIRSPPSSTT